MAIILDFPQRSPEWYEARERKLTASDFHRVMNGRPETWAKIMDALRYPQEKRDYRVKSLEWGIKHEARALAHYMLQTGNEVRQVGFVISEAYPILGASPDGLVGPVGGVEIKCPSNTQNHINTLALGMPDKHLAQVQGGMFVSEREWWDFVSYDPRLPKQEDRLFIQRIERDEVYIAKLEERLSLFIQLLSSGTCPVKYFAEQMESTTFF